MLWAIMAIIATAFTAAMPGIVGVQCFCLFCLGCELILWQMWVLASWPGIRERFLAACGGSLAIGMFVALPVGFALLPLRPLSHAYKSHGKDKSSGQFEIRDLAKITLLVAIKLAIFSWLIRALDPETLGNTLNPRLLIIAIGFVAIVAAQSAWLVLSGYGAMLRLAPTMVLVSIFLANAPRFVAMWNQEVVVLLALLAVAETIYLALCLIPLRMSGVRLRLAWKNAGNE